MSKADMRLEVEAGPLGTIEFRYALSEELLLNTSPHALWRTMGDYFLHKLTQAHTALQRERGLQGRQ